jgi:FAD/FMN-containing dehydrogenase
MGGEMATTEEDLASALEGFAGEALQPGDPAYDDTRRVQNGLIDRRPVLIARCRGAADVVQAVALARDQGLEVSIRGGGHSLAGYGVTDGGVMIDLSLMKGIHVDPLSGTARAQGGVTWGELNRETQLHGLAVTGGFVSTTGIAGLTLGGGLGWLMSKHGVAADNLLSAEVVTADSRVLTASASENSDLFWALRGGGGNFGVVTSLEYRVHPVGPIVTAGPVVHAFDDAANVLRFFRDFTADIPDELSVIGALGHAPDGSGTKVAVVLACHVGSPEEAERDLAPLTDFGSPIDVQLGPMPYAVVNTLFDDSYPKGSLNYWKSTFLGDLSDGAIEAMMAHFAVSPSTMGGTTMGIEHFHGEVTRVPADATAIPHRQPGYDVLVTAIWTDPQDTDENIAWARDAYAALKPFAVDRRYVNYLDADDAGEDPTRAAFGSNYARLADVKTKYDPANLFHLNQNIKPG